MNIDIPREYVRLCSFGLFVTGAIVLIFGGWQHPQVNALGITLMAGSIWFVLMSESILLQRVQSEMGSSLEILRKRQEHEIRELILFLQEAKVGASPFSSMEGSQKLLKNIQYPAMVVTTNHQIVKANALMHNLLGWDPESRDLDGQPVYIINDPIVMSTLGGLATSPEVQEKDSMITQYVYVHKSGKRIFGQLDVHKVNTAGFFVVFHPASQCLLSYEDIISLTS